MLFLIQSGLLSFAAALFIALMGILTWHLGRSVPVAIMNFCLAVMNIGFGIMNIVTHPGIWN